MTLCNYYSASTVNSILLYSSLVIVITEVATTVILYHLDDRKKNAVAVEKVYSILVRLPPTMH
jgi:hypothetical protein